MVSLIKETAQYWKYMSQGQKDLLLEGEYLMNDIIKDHAFQFKDYSFLVFPFAKAYEGFLKQLFLDINFISRLDYISDHLRLGKLMSPNLVLKLGDRSLFTKIKEAGGEELAQEIWHAWKMGRNQIFHYFPHNLRSVTFLEAQKEAEEILFAMEHAFDRLKTAKAIRRLEKYITS